MDADVHEEWDHTTPYHEKQCQQLNCFCPDLIAILFLFFLAHIVTNPLAMFHLSQQQFSVYKQPQKCMNASLMGSAENQI